MRSHARGKNFRPGDEEFCTPSALQHMGGGGTVHQTRGARSTSALSRVAVAQQTAPVAGRMG
eukprot:6452548-Pyramimonas_sp.AAC.1